MARHKTAATETARAISNLRHPVSRPGSPRPEGVCCAFNSGKDDPRPVDNVPYRRKWLSIAVTRWQICHTITSNSHRVNNWLTGVFPKVTDHPCPTIGRASCRERVCPYV